MISLPAIVFGQELGDVLVRSQARLRLGVRHLLEKVDGNFRQRFFTSTLQTSFS